MGLNKIEGETDLDRCLKFLESTKIIRAMDEMLLKELSWKEYYRYYSFDARVKRVEAKGSPSLVVIHDQNPKDVFYRLLVSALEFCESQSVVRRTSRVFHENKSSNTVGEAKDCRGKRTEKATQTVAEGRIVPPRQAEENLRKVERWLALSTCSCVFHTNKKPYTGPDRRLGLATGLSYFVRTYTRG